MKCACTSMRRASRAVCHLYDLVLAPTGIKSSQFTMLQTIAQAGEIAQCDLARQLVASEETFSRRLASARKGGWVKMRIGERRKRLCSLTDEGMKVLDAAWPYWERAEARMKQALGDLAWQELAGFADRVARAALQAERAPVHNRHPEAIVLGKLSPNAASTPTQKVS